MYIENDLVKSIVNGIEKTDSVSIQQVNFLNKASGISGLVTGQTTLIDINNGGSTNVRFIPSRAIVRLTDIAGVISTPVILRIGNNGTYDNVAQLTTMTGLNTTQLCLPFTLSSSLTSVDLSSTAISVDVQTAAVGVDLSVYTFDVYLWGTIE